MPVAANLFCVARVAKVSDHVRVAEVHKTLKQDPFDIYHLSEF